MDKPFYGVCTIETIILVVRREELSEKPSPRGEGVDQRETDEGTFFPIDAGLGEAVCVPRIVEMPRTLC